MKSETNFCPRCGKPVWRSPADAIHTCSPPDKTRDSSHWDGCWATRGHHDCAIGRVDRLERELAEWQNGERQYPPAVEDARELTRKLNAARFDLAECKRDAERYRWLREQCEKGDLVIARCGTWELESWFSDDPDAAIDAAQGKT